MSSGIEKYERITTKAGTFDVFLAVPNSEQFGRTYKTTFRQWYAPDPGVTVKFEVTTNGNLTQSGEALPSRASDEDDVTGRLLTIRCVIEAPEGAIFMRAPPWEVRMSSLVIQLQEAALDPNAKITDLLRRALAVARKLSVVDFEEWIMNELNGYQKGKDVPPYRELRGLCQALNHFGWQDVLFGDNKTADMFTLRPVTDPIASISEQATRATSTEGGQLYMQYPPVMITEVLKQAPAGYSRVRLCFEPADFTNIVETVKNNVLDWALKLEKAGVLGEGMTFSSNEQDRAKAVATAPSYHATNLTVIHGNQAAIQQGSPSATQTYTVKSVDIGKLRGLIAEVRKIADQVPANDQAQLKADLATLEAQAAAPTPSPGIVMEAAASVRKILESAAGSLTAANVPALVQKLAALLS